MNSNELKTQVLPSLVAGTGRRPCKLSDPMFHDGDEKAMLKALTLTGQTLRFEIPAAPASYSLETRINDARRILPDAVRRPLLRLLQCKRVSEDLPLALAWSFERLKLRPHPFDLPKLDGFVRRYAEFLGAGAQHWAAREVDSGKEPNYFGDEELDDTNWTSAVPAHRARFLTERRRKNAQQARTLLEAAWKQLDAETRLKLLTSMQVGLSEGDKEFLERLGSDRAPRVRALAERLLGRLSGSSGERPALRALMERIVQTRAGLLKKRTVLNIELPVTVKEQAVHGWIRETFAEVSCDELARCLGLSEKDMIEAAAEDRNLMLGLALMTTQDGRLELLEALVKRSFHDAWPEMTRTGAVDLDAMSEQQRGRWAEILVRPYGATPPAGYLLWSWLHHALKGTLPETIFVPVVQPAKWLDDVLNEAQLNDEWLELLAASCPVTLRGQLRKRLEAVEPSLAGNAIQALDILEAMEKA